MYPVIFLAVASSSSWVIHFTSDIYRPFSSVLHPHCTEPTSLHRSSPYPIHVIHPLSSCTWIHAPWQRQWWNVACQQGMGHQICRVFDLLPPVSHRCTLWHHSTAPMLSQGESILVGMGAHWTRTMKCQGGQKRQIKRDYPQKSMHDHSIYRPESIIWPLGSSLCSIQKAVTQPWAHKLIDPKQVSPWKPKATYWLTPLVSSARPILPATNPAPPTTVPLTDPTRFPFSITSIGNVTLNPIYKFKYLHLINVTNKNLVYEK